jgi:nitrogen regulatory protein P-II 2
MPLKTQPLKLLVIVAEAVLRDRLVAELKALGVPGCTLTTAMSWGREGLGSSEWEGPSMRLEVIAPPEVVDDILVALSERYFPTWAVMAWVSDASVVRPEKYAVAPRPLALTAS